MTPPKVRYLSAALGAGILFACSHAVPSEFGGPTPVQPTTSVARSFVPARADHGKPWRSLELIRSKTPVLFVSDSAAATVYIYSISTLRIIGKVTGFSQPQGECSDNHGNVWVTDTNAQIIYKLTHRGLLENEINDGTGYPAACAWDRKTGDLAVMNLFGTGSVGGDVLIYTSGSGYPKSYTNPSQYFYNFGGYDTSGNLFFDGRDASGNFMLSELSKGAQKAQTITISGGTIYFPGMVQWDSSRNELIVGDQSCGGTYVSCLYAIQLSGNSGKIVGHINLKSYSGGQICDLVQGVIYNNQLFGSDYDFCGYASSATYAWPYPGGGAPTHDNKTTVSAPVGATISL